jgi:opacity protein-like surface antigen
MYHFHLGTDTCWNLGGWGVALFAEIGYTEKDDSWTSQRGNIIGTPVELDVPNGNGLEMEDSFTGDLDELASLLSYAAQNSPYNTGYDLDIMPITLNVKLERPLTDSLNFYLGGGLGVALVDLSVDVGPMSFSDDDWVFVGQLFTGLNYNFNPDFEVYGGVRWIYYDDADFSDSGSTVTLEIEDDFLFEIGARFNF